MSASDGGGSTIRKVEPLPARPEPDHILGLDGLRAVSVLVVMLYHAHVSWMTGGFLGVEVFFAISGFLITRRILQDHERLNLGFWAFLGRFWKRRFGRLLPALWLVLAFLAIWGAFVLGPRASQFRGDFIPSLAYYENWYQILSGNSYFADQGFPLLRHIWSLAVEEQFYIVWPLLVAGVLWTCKAWRKALMIMTGVLAVASLGAMLRLADPGNPSSLAAAESLNRAYLGTDTRAFGLLAGVMLTLAIHGKSLGRPSRPGLEAGLMSVVLAALLGMCVVADSQMPFLYRGGFVVVDALTLLLIVGLLRQGTGPVTALLKSRPMEWMGQRSYGIYLWHWPIFRLVGEGQDGIEWLLLRWGLTFLAAGLSFRWVEAPVLDWVRGRSPSPSNRRGQQIWKYATATSLLLLFGLSTQAAVHLVRLPTYRDEVQESLRINAAALDASSASPTPNIEPGVAPHEALRAHSGRIISSQPHLPLDLPVLPAGGLEGLHVTAIGDSVMKGAALALKEAGEAQMGKGSIVINAEESRSFKRAYDIAKAYKDQQRLGDVVVIHLGANNSSIPEKEFNRLADLLADRKLVLFLTVKSDKVNICDEVNAHLTQMIRGVPNARVMDWQELSSSHPELFYSDQTHLKPSGARYYASHILSRIHEHKGTREEPSS